MALADGGTNAMRMNWANYLFLPVDGYGRLGLKTVQALLRLGHDVHPFTIDALDTPAWFQQAQGITFDKATIQLMPPHNMKHLPGRSIGFSMHESSQLPEGWANHINAKCEWMIAPSTWIAEIMANGGVKVPIEVVPGAIDPQECALTMPNKSRPYTFGCLADRGMRKGFDLVWTAFYQAFEPRNRNVRLVIKCRPGSLPRLDFSYSRDDRLTVWKADVPDIADIYAQFDAYIFPSRCEGLGMPAREAAACGVPTVATRWSGLADDIDQWAIPLEKFDIVESHMDTCGGDWAEPSLDELVWRMRWLYDHQDEARADALKRAQWLRDNRTYAHAAKRLVSILANWLGGPPELHETTDKQTGFTVPLIDTTVRRNGHPVAEVTL